MSPGSLRTYLQALLIKDPAIIAATVGMATLSLASSVLDPRGRAQDAIARRWSRMLLRISGLRVHITGLEHIDPSRCYVFFGNYLSLMDTPVVLGSLPARFLFMANEKYFRVPFLGWHLRRAGHLPATESDPRGSLKSMSAAARLIRERSLSMLLFPEGSRARGPMQEFKEGAAYIAIKAGVPLVPMAISGTREALPVGSVHVRGGPVELRIGEPIPTANLTLKDRSRLTQVMRERIVELLEGKPVLQ